MSTAKIFDFSAAHERRSSRMENQKQGHFALFRSLLSREWAKDTAKLAMWVRLIGEAAYKPRTVEFSGKTWHLQPGELVTTAAIMGRKLRDQDGHEKSPQAVTRMINFFAREGMLTTKGTRFGTVICIKNYADYQVILPDEPSEEPSGNNKPSRSKASRYAPDEPSEEPSGEQNKKLLEQEYKSLTEVRDMSSTPENSKKKIDTQRLSCEDVWSSLKEHVPDAKGWNALTPKRRQLIQKFWREAKPIARQMGDSDSFGMPAFIQYLDYVHTSCRWMFEQRHDQKTGKTWQKRNYEFILNAELYAQVREGVRDDR
ncbi:replication protein [Pantoea sp. BAV 3049]|uniref:replication protein n=1 Tax=Pantoea sp. BAV 3049 TaxID=2654188 RepID=UPI001E5AE02D|nr:replication protein [Pantoea sp. BAV 3049]